MNIKLISLFLFLLIFAANISQAQKTISLKGQVSDSDNTQIKLEASIQYTDSNGKIIKAQTNGKGEYTIDIAPNQTYMVKLNSNGYYEQNFPLEITDNLETKNHYLIKTTTLTPVKPKILQSIYFDLSSAELSKSSKAYLDKIVVILEENPIQRIKITGYSDKGSHSDLDLELSIERAETIASYLQSKGIGKARIIVRGKGNVSLIVPSPNQKNRRVEMQLVQ